MEISLLGAELYSKGKQSAWNNKMQSTCRTKPAKKI
jgi:hypothetical protein